MLENAIYHGMTYADGDGEIHVRAFRDGCDVVIEVTDNGPGMPEDVVERLLEALRNGADIVTDTQMARAGISKKTLERFGGKARCFISDEDVAQEATRRGVTRAVVSMEKACSLPGHPIFAIGNAPTALLAIKELYESGRLTPAGVIGVPVGFVNVVESKEEMIETDLPCIIARGRKGGSNVAAAICNALLYQL